MIFGAVLAGGTGTRMKNAPLPKQFLPLGDCPVLIRTLRVFLACDALAHTLVGVPESWVAYTKELLAVHFPHADIPVIAGGSTRTDTLFSVMDAAQARFGTHDNDLIVTHDAVRPFVTQRMIADNIAAAQEAGACGTAIPSVDTILESDGGRTIDAIPPRTRMYQMQTPQTFQIRLLRDTFAALGDAEKARLTDGCGILIARGLPVRLVMGSPRNLKITTPTDYAMAQALAVLPEE